MASPLKQAKPVGRPAVQPGGIQDAPPFALSDWLLTAKALQEAAEYYERKARREGEYVLAACFWEIEGVAQEIIHRVLVEQQKKHTP